MLALFDLDGTLINTKSLIDFYEFHLTRNLGADEAEEHLREFRQEIAEKYRSGKPRKELNRWFYSRYFGGLDRHQLAAEADEWFALSLKQPDFFNAAVVQELAKRKAEGFEAVMVTGSFYEVVYPIANYLGFSHIVCAPLAVDLNCYTGELTDEPTISEGKAKAVERFALHHEKTLTGSFGYGDDTTDFAFLELVDCPFVVGANDMAHVAKARGWGYLQGTV